MRAGRLVTLLLLLQRRGRMTADELAAELEVSRRTVLRDIEALSGAGVPVYATRGPGGGFQLLEGFTPDLAGPEQWRPKERRPGRPRLASVRVSPEGRRVAAVTGRLQPLRVRRAVPPDADGWCEATFRLWSMEGAVADLLSLGPLIEVTGPPELRDQVADRLTRAAARYRNEGSG
jgi:predicted DNA-binding transcriptional regulator YafY